MKRARLLVTVVTLVSVLTTGIAEAATPASGTLSKKVRTLKWTGSFTLSEPTPQGGCVLEADDPICDHFMLKVDLPDGSRIRVELPAPNLATDLDLEVYSADGAEVGSSGNLPGSGEAVEFRHRGRLRNKPYEVRIVPYLVAPGTTYKATAKAK